MLTIIRQHKVATKLQGCSRVGCGHKEELITVEKLEFPLWLIRLRIQPVSMHHSYHHHLHSSLLNPNWPCKGTACLHPKRSQLLEIRGENNVCVKTAVFKIGTWSPHPHLCPVRRWGRNRIKLSHQWLVHVVTKVAVGKAMLQPRMPFFFGHLTAYGIPGPGVRSELQLWPAGVAMLDPLTHRAGPGMQPVSWCCRDATDAVVPWQELREVLIFNSDK